MIEVFSEFARVHYYLFAVTSCICAYGLYFTLIRIFEVIQATVIRCTLIREQYRNKPTTNKGDE